MDKVIVWLYFLLILFAINLLQLMSGCGITTRVTMKENSCLKRAQEAQSLALKGDKMLSVEVLCTHMQYPYTMTHQCLTTDIS